MEEEIDKYEEAKKLLGETFRTQVTLVIVTLNLPENSRNVLNGLMAVGWQKGRVDILKEFTKR